MAFVHHDEVEEVGAELLVDVALFVGAGDGLVERQVNLVAFVHQLGGFVDGQIYIFDRHRAVRIHPLHALCVGAELGHGALEGAKVVDHGLVDEDVAVGQKQDALFGAALPQAPDDLEGGVRFAGAGGHDQQHAFLPGGDGLDRAVDGVELVVARGFVGGVIKPSDAAFFGGPALPGAVAVPQLLWRREFFEGEVLLQHACGQGGIAEHKTVAIAGEAERHIEQLRVVERLAHACANGVLVVLGLNHRQGNVGLVEQGVVGAQHRAFVAVGLVAAHHHASSPQGVFTKDLVQTIPSSLLHGRADEFVAEVAFGKVALVHSVVRTDP